MVTTDQTMAAHLLEQAKVIAASAETWADLSNALFDPDMGIITAAYRTSSERVEFRKTEEYRAIRRLITDAIDRTGLIEGATPKRMKPQ